LGETLEHVGIVNIVKDVRGVKDANINDNIVSIVKDANTANIVFLHFKNQVQKYIIADFGNLCFVAFVNLAMIANLGIHVAKGADVAESLAAAAAKYSLAAAQIFTHGPQSIARVKYDPGQVREAAVAAHLRLYVHSTYLTTVWRTDGDGHPNKRDMDHALDQFAAADEIGALGVVIHIPKLEVGAVAHGVSVLVEERKRNPAHHAHSSKIILEMKALACHKTQSYETPKKIMDLVAEMASLGITPADVGICIDTAHIAAGRARIRTYAEAVAYLAAIDPRWIALIHLNGNEYDGNVRAGDKHCLALSEADKVWPSIEYADSGCRAFVEFAHANNIDYILELHAEKGSLDSAMATFAEMIK
jgi:endonuclease IV